MAEGAALDKAAAEDAFKRAVAALKVAQAADKRYKRAEDKEHYEALQDGMAAWTNYRTGRDLFAQV
eukprot:COSAG04_NODE_26178_length_298_cov_0.869347_1_plen_65_part_01